MHFMATSEKHIQSHESCSNIELGFSFQKKMFHVEPSAGEIIEAPSCLLRRYDRVAEYAIRIHHQVQSLGMVEVYLYIYSLILFSVRECVSAYHAYAFAWNANFFSSLFSFVYLFNLNYACLLPMYGYRQINYVIITKNIYTYVESFNLFLFEL